MVASDVFFIFIACFVLLFEVASKLRDRHAC